MQTIEKSIEFGKLGSEYSLFEISIELIAEFDEGLS